MHDRNERTIIQQWNQGQGYKKKHNWKKPGKLQQPIDSLDRGTMGDLRSDDFRLG